MSFLKTAQLPRGRVTDIALGGKYRDRLELPLQKLGIRCEWLPGAPVVDSRLSGHADLLLLHLGGDRFAAADGLSLPEWLPAVDKVPVDKNDAALNSCAVGEYWICCKKTAALIPAGKTVIPVRQRYTRCSVCIVDERGIITADRGIAKAVEGRSIDCLLIEPGHIRLDGFPYGFIGGASFKIAPDQLVFTGSLAQHPDGEKINSFLAARGIRPILLTEEPVFDIGSAVLLTEAVPE